MDLINLCALAHRQLTSLASSTLVSSVSGGIPAGTEMVVMQCEGQNVRYRDDGTAPTASIGLILIVGTMYEFEIQQISEMRVIETTTSAKLNLAFYGTRT